MSLSRKDYKISEKMRDSTNIIRCRDQLMEGSREITFQHVRAKKYLPKRGLNSVRDLRISQSKVVESRTINQQQVVGNQEAELKREIESLRMKLQESEKTIEQQSETIVQIQNALRDFHNSTVEMKKLKATIDQVGGSSEYPARPSVSQQSPQSDGIVQQKLPFSKYDNNIETIEKDKLATPLSMMTSVSPSSSMQSGMPFPSSQPKSSQKLPFSLYESNMEVIENDENSFAKTLPNTVSSNSVHVSTYSDETPATTEPPIKKSSTSVTPASTSIVKRKVPVPQPVVPYQKPCIPWTCITYLAIKNSVSGTITTADITRFTIHHFPGLRPYSKETIAGLSGARQVSAKWITKKEVTGSSRTSLWSIKKEPKNLIKKWKNDFEPTSALTRDTFEKLLRGELKIAFDEDGNVKEEDHISVRYGSHYSLAKAVEYLIKKKNNSLSYQAQVRLVREKFPNIQFHTDDPPMEIAKVIAKPWFVKTDIKAIGHQGILWSVDDNKKGLPLLSREGMVPQIIWKMIVDAEQYKTIGNPSGVSYYFYAVDKDGNEVPDGAEDCNYKITCRLQKKLGKYKTFVSWFTKPNGVEGVNKYQYNIGTSEDIYVTTGHQGNMTLIKAADKRDADGPGAGPKVKSCRAPRKMKRIDTDMVTEYSDALAWFSASSHRVNHRVRNMLRAMYDVIAVDGGDHEFFSELAWNVMWSLPLPHDSHFEFPNGFIVEKNVIVVA